jgi:hypothetical protein
MPTEIENIENELKSIIIEAKSFFKHLSYATNQYERLNKKMPVGEAKNYINEYSNLTVTLPEGQKLQQQVKLLFFSLIQLFSISSLSRIMKSVWNSLLKSINLLLMKLQNLWNYQQIFISILEMKKMTFSKYLSSFIFI